jgi:hypothetical protein
MQLTRSHDEGITISGNIKTLDDYQAIRDMATKILSAGGTSLSLQILDSFSMPSAVIGFLVKLIHKEKVRVSMEVGDKRLLELLDELHLVELFDARLRPTGP